MFFKKALVVVFGLVPNLLIGVAPVFSAIAYLPRILSSDPVLVILLAGYSIAYLLGTLALIQFVVSELSRISVIGLAFGAISTFLFVVSPFIFEFLESISVFNSPIDNFLLALVASAFALLPLTVFCVLLYWPQRPNTEPRE